MSIEPLTRARRREMTRRHLLDAAALVFAREGFHRASLDDVAATAGFTKGAVYSNFANKDELFLAVFEDRYAQEQTEMRRVLTEDEQPYELGDHSEVFNRVRHEICITILETFAREGIEFAYPTQTSFTAAPDGTMIMPYPAPETTKRATARGEPTPDPEA